MKVIRAVRELVLLLHLFTGLLPRGNGAEDLTVVEIDEEPVTRTSSDSAPIPDGPCKDFCIKWGENPDNEVFTGEQFTVKCFSNWDDQADGPFKQQCARPSGTNPVCPKDCDGHCDDTGDLLCPPNPAAKVPTTARPLPDIHSSCLQICHLAIHALGFMRPYEVRCGDKTANPRDECGHKCPYCPGPLLNNHCRLIWDDEGRIVDRRVRCPVLEPSAMKQPECRDFCRGKAWEMGRKVEDGPFIVYCGEARDNPNECGKECPKDKCYNYCDINKEGKPRMICPALEPKEPPNTTTDAANTTEGSVGKKQEHEMAEEDTKKAITVGAVVGLTLLVLVAGSVWFLMFRKDATVAPGGRAGGH